MIGTSAGRLDMPRRGGRIARWAPVSLVVPAVLAGLVGLAPAAQASSPGADGQIAYVASQDGDLEIYVMAGDGSNQTNLTNDPARDQDPAWSPDGSRIAWSSTTAGAHLDIWVMNADGSGRTNLTPLPNQTGVAGTGIQPTWSPDGSRIAFACNGDIWTIGSDGSTPVNLTDDPALPAAGGEPAWSPDGTRIAYTRGADLWVMNVDGTGKTQLTFTTGGLGVEKAPDWSPDGVHVVYERSGRIWRMHADGTAQQALTGGPGEAGTRPTWSPSGTKIVFSSNAFGAPNGYDVFTMNPDGTSVTRLTTAVPGGESDPSWQASAPADRLPSYLTLGIGAGPAVTASGELFTAQPGAAIKVTLSVKRGGRFEKVKTSTAATDAVGAYGTSFAAPDATTCKVTARFAGNAERSGVSRTVTFNCP